MDEELLKELDSILQPAVSSAWQSAKNTSYGGDPSTAFLDFFKVEIDHTKVDLSKRLCKLDLAMNGFTTDAERAESEFIDSFGQDEKLPEVNESDYVRQVNDGFEVWDGIRWVQLSKQANIKVEIFQDPNNGNRPAVRVWAQDPETKTSVVFVDNDIAAPGWDVGYTRTGDGFDPAAELAAIQRGGYYEDPFYNITKNSIGIGGSVAGALELRHLGNMTPWRTGNAFRNADGWYRNAEGLYENLSKQRDIGGGGYQKSAQRALKKADFFKGAGKLFFAAGVLTSGYEFGHAYATQDVNRKEVYAKASVDILIGAIGTFGGPVGWIIAGTYFIIDVSGGFGDWGQSTGISQGEYNKYLMKKIQHEHGAHIQSLQFEVDYVAPIEQQQNELYIEERTVKRDNTTVAMPKILFLKD